MKVNAYSLTEDSLVSFLKQVSHNRFPSLPTDTGLQNSCIYKCIEVQLMFLLTLLTYVCVVRIESPIMITPPAMFPRPLNSSTCISSPLPAWDSDGCYSWHASTVICCASCTNIQQLFSQGHSLIPPISITYSCYACRKTDQYSKACSILAKSNPVMDLTDKSSGSCSRTVSEQDVSFRLVNTCLCRVHAQLPPMRALLEQVQRFPSLPIPENGFLQLMENAISHVDSPKETSPT